MQKSSGSFYLEIVIKLCMSISESISKHLV